MRRWVPAILVAIALLAVGFAAARAEPPLSPLDAWRVGPVRFPHDPFDLERYAELGRWVQDGSVPYRDYAAEYPPLAVAFFGLLQAVDASPRGFVELFTAFTVAAALGLLLVTRGALQRLGRSPWRLAILALPSALYFTVNRFDVLVALPLVAALVALLARRYRTAGVLLGLGVGIKFFPVLLAPLFFAVERADRPGTAWHRLRFPLAFVAMSVACYLIPAVFWGGANVVTGVLQQLVRPPTVGTLLTTLALPFTVSNQHPLVHALRFVFVGLTLIPLGWSAVARIPAAGPDRTRVILALAGLVLAVTVLLNPFFSPQFVLWLSPVLLLLDAKPRAWWVALVILLDLTTFVQFPVVFDRIGPFTTATAVAALVRSAVFAALVAVLARTAFPILRPARARP